MPTRILREGILTSLKVNTLSEREELFYRRLMSVVDDYGRFFAHPAILRAHCYPLRLDKVNEADVKQMLSRCVSVGLVGLYNDEKHLFLVNFKQQTRSPSKYPQPSEEEVLSICKSNALGDGDGDGDGDGGGGGGEGVKRQRRSPGEPAQLPPEVQLWNSHPMLPKVLSMSSDRTKSLQARLRESGWAENYRLAVEKILQTPFCMGQNNRGWKADFDFIIRPGSVTRVLEGKYDNNSNGYNNRSPKPSEFHIWRNNQWIDKRRIGPNLG